jgi:putative PIN family toxin of toxin-antitoxin system
VLSAVIDPNVLISAAISGKGAPAVLSAALLQRKFQLVVSPKLLDELKQVLLRPRFRRYISENAARVYVARVRALANLCADPPAQPGLTPDPKDDYLVALAQTAGVDYVVSGDADLLNLASAKPPIVTPAAFAALL